MKRKEFIKLASTSALSLSSLGHLSFNLFREPFFKLSLAQWSFNKSIRYGSMSPYSFAKTAKDLGFGGLEYVNQLSDPVLKEENGVKLIEEFAKKYTYFGLIRKAEQKDKLTFLFAGLYQKAKDRRNRQYEGIIKFVDRQESLRKAIGSASKELRKLRKDKVDQKNQKFVNANSKLKWNTRVFDQRTRLTEYICEEPVFNTQRLGYQSRKIMSYLK